MKKAIKDLKKISSIDKKQSLFMQILELVLAVFAATMTKEWITANSVLSGQFIAMVIVIDVAYLLMVLLRMWKSQHTPTVIADYVEAINDTRNLEYELARKKTIDEFIDKSIMSLNAHTCNWVNAEPAPVCDNPIMDGFKEVWEPLISAPQYLLNTAKTKYTVIVSIENSPYIEGHGLGTDTRSPLHLAYREEVFVLRDDYNLAEEIKACLESKTESRGYLLKVYQQGIESYNDIKLVNQLIEFPTGKILQLITVPVPSVCEEINNGTMFILCDDEINIPSDLEKLLMIFNRIATNWVSKYNDCLTKKVQNDLYEAIEVARSGGHVANIPTKLVGTS
jgi:hypothetical protein